MSHGERKTISIGDIVFGALSLVVLALSTPLLFWLGRIQQPRCELVVDADLFDDTDDPGTDVDAYREGDVASGDDARTGA